MSDQFKGVTLSFIIHAIVFLTVIGISSSAVPMSKPIVIDFTIEDSTGDKEVTLQAALPSKGHEKITKKMVEEIVNPFPAKEEKPKIEQEETVYESPVAPFISEAQVPIPEPIPLEHNADSKGKEHNPVAGGITGVSSTGRGANVASAGGSGDSVERVKMKYLKTNFVYIRDLIMKNISYPYEARRMGWEGKVTVSFVVAKNGYVDSIKIEDSSGFEVLDKNAEETIKMVCPFPKPPIEAQIIIPIIYKLNQSR